MRAARRALAGIGEQAILAAKCFFDAAEYRCRRLIDEKSAPSSMNSGSIKRNSGGREMLDQLPDGIHSGLSKPNAKGMFFYFKVRTEDENTERHFWKYYDLKTGEILDNRFLIANLISCDRDTPRVICDCDVFDIQEKIMQNILENQQRIQALEATPKTTDAIQQTLAATLQGYLNSPKVKCRQLLEAIKYLT